MQTADAILIAGGYGVVGAQIAETIRRRHPDLPLVIAGRSAEKAAACARALDADWVELDTERPNPLDAARPRAVVDAVNDPHDHLLKDAVGAGIPYLDITRWTERVRAAASMVDAAAPSAPVMLASGWMGGVAAVLAAALSRRLERTDSIDISVLYSLKDKAGPNSTEYMDRLATPFEVSIGGRTALVRPYTDPRRVAFPDGRTARAYRFDTPDQLTLPATTGAATVAARIAFDSAASTGLLVALTRSGIWKLVSGDRFTPLRRKLLYNPGAGASHEIVVEAEGVGQGGEATAMRATVVDPAGQTHLTAVGATIQLERLLGLDGAPPPAAGIVYPDTAPQVESALQALRDAGVVLTLQRRVAV